MDISLLVFLFFASWTWKNGASEPRCKLNEVKDECLGEKTCKSFFWKKRDHCPVSCTSGCVCEEGFVRRAGKCIPFENCPEREKDKLNCKENEEEDDTGLRCESTCANRVPICKPNCEPPRCFCLPGLVRNNDRCITESQCPPKIK